MRLEIRGSVQGVGFRPFVFRTAAALGLRGSVRNVGEGVRVDAFGACEALQSLREQLAAPPLPGAWVEAIECRGLETPSPAPADFAILESGAGGGGAIALAPDLPICERCLEELFDASSRRYRYPFIACAACGPRYTLARRHPYDRERTTLDRFPLCGTCAAEYRDPGDRRFHAEATACPDCGPVLRCLGPEGELFAEGDAAISAALSTLRAGRIVAVHGVGGFQLACDAGDEDAVLRLRERKRRPGKPLAVMVRTPIDAEKLAWLESDEHALLASRARPIVPLQRRRDAGLAPSVSPGSPRVGLFLAYSPLHVLLLQGFGGPLVMTSANRTGEPIAYDLADSRAELGELADRILAHDRAIVTACDDSVAVAAASGPIVVRRARGHVPRPIRLPRPVPGPVLACGGQWSNTVCIAYEDHAWLSAHVGDLDSPASVGRLEETVGRWLDWLGVEPEWIAHDLHPGYESTRFAQRCGERWPDARRVAVQHHHAHLAAVLAEHGIEGPAHALAWDGTGYGGDGSAWGGELLFGGAATATRLATFRPIRLAGGERAIAEPWRLALALLDDAFDGDPPLAELALFRRIEPTRIERVRALLSRPELSPDAHGVGRYFDAVGSLLGIRPCATFQGELAQAVNFMASSRPAIAYAFDLDTRSMPWTLDLRPTVRALTRELRADLSGARIAERFHATLVAAGGAAVRHALGLQADAVREPTLVLGGGCFQNSLLVDGFERSLGRDVRLLRPRTVPPGDGGLALGQACVAAARSAAAEPA